MVSRLMPGLAVLASACSRISIASALSRPRTPSMSLVRIYVCSDCPAAVARRR